MTHKNLIAMVYPYGILNRYMKFYDEFLKDYIFKLQNEIRIIIIAGSIQSEQLINDKFPENNYETIVIPEAVDIWIRDWAPVPLNTYGNEYIYLKPDFKTGYYNGMYQNYIPKLNKAGSKLSEYLGIKTIPLPLKSDGGNFAYNGKDTVILTNRIISNNESFSIGEIESSLKQIPGIEKVIFIPVEPGDVTGHTDGTVRFIDEETVVIASYPEKYTTENLFACKLAKELSKQLGNNYKIIQIANEIIRDESSRAVTPSATGNYINFLKLGSKIYLPQYGIHQDLSAYKTLKYELPACEIIRVNIKDIRQISKDGGVLNCITWNSDI